MSRVKKWLGDLKRLYHWGHGFDTPQGLLVLLSLPLCLLAAIAAFVWPPETRPVFLSGEPVLFLFTPLLAYVFFIREGQRMGRAYASSIYISLLVLAIVTLPFYVPYFRH